MKEKLRNTISKKADILEFGKMMVGIKEEKTVNSIKKCHKE